MEEPLGGKEHAQPAGAGGLHGALPQDKEDRTFADVGESNESGTLARHDSDLAKGV